MKKFIEVYDDFIPKFLVDEVENFCINSGEIGFQFIPNVTGLDQSKHLPGMSRLFYTDDGKVSEYSSFLSQILYYFSFKKNITIHEIIAARYYINDSEGDTVFFDDNKKEIKRVSPKKGRIVFFNGNQLHSGSYPTNTPRFILNFNFNGKINLI